MRDEDWASFAPSERKFAIRWLALEGAQRELFLRDLLAAIEVLQRLGVLNDPESAATA